MKNIEHMYPSLYEKTGNILHLNTFLVPLRTLSELHDRDDQLKNVFPLFVMGFASLMQIIADDELQTTFTEEEVLMWMNWVNQQSQNMSDDLLSEDVVRNGFNAMDSYLMYQGDLARKVTATGQAVLTELVRVSEELGLNVIKDDTDDRTTGQVNA